MSSLRFNRPPDTIEGIHLSGDIIGCGVFVEGVVADGVQAVWRGKTRETFLIVRTVDREHTQQVGREFANGDFNYAVRRSIIIERPITEK